MFNSELTTHKYINMGKEPLNSKRIQVINFQIGDIHMSVTNLSESLIDAETIESLKIIEKLKEKLNSLKDQVTNGDITKKYKH